jgi:uncharacterized protein YbjT (DUF2867 family)
MAHMPQVLVTGATGHIGREVVAALQRRGAHFRVGARSALKAESPAEHQAVAFDFADARSYAPAVAGCDSVFLLRPPAISNTRQTLNRFVDVARAAGVRQIVFISVAGAANNPIVPHHAVEQHLRASPSSWTILRPGFFAQNLESAYRQDVCNDDRIHVPTGRGRVAFVHTRDVAAVALNVLLDPAAHSGQTYNFDRCQRAVVC